MRYLAQLLTLLLLTTSLAWAWERPCTTCDAAAAPVASTAPAPEQPGQGLLPSYHHCSHLSAHLLGQPPGYFLTPWQGAAAPSAPSPALALYSLSDTPLRPPAASFA